LLPSPLAPQGGAPEAQPDAEAAGSDSDGGAPPPPARTRGGKRGKQQQQQQQPEQPPQRQLPEHKAKADSKKGAGRKGKPGGGRSFKTLE
jgi:hypothetical protein